ncbi:rhythmically expressed gene 2 protein-like [Topomyia yanbarensis]|uniref:rhythmically expressed gene 2 protein-like n=1 Tax=Topomyia yanbarensis TaxID=2498891 RepID=UPI00273B11DC|nr:rhythmically expressed gene 2 protein-like [Topomyia yanbarensis]
MTIGGRSNSVARHLSRFKLVTFDVTDTLLKFSRPPEIQYALAARQHGCVEINEQAIARSFRSHFKRMARDYPNFGKRSENDWLWWWRTLVMDIFRDSHSHIDETMLSRVADQLIENYKTRDCWSEIELASSVMEIARTHCNKVGIISNFDPRLSKILETMALPKVDFVLTSYETGILKPDREIFNIALRLCNTVVLPSEALHIGNTPKLDYIGAKNAGWASVLVNVTNEAEREISFNPEINPKHVFKTFGEFIQMLQSEQTIW